MREEGISSAIVIAIVIVIAAVGVGAYVMLSEGEEGEGPGGGGGPVIQQGSITLVVTDTETGLSADDTDVYVDGEYVGTTAQGGELDIPAVSLGRHRITVLVPYYEEAKVDRYVDVQGDERVNVNIDMPNPDFLASVDAWHHYGLQEWGDVRITLTNMGEVNSDDTVALVQIYLEENPTQCVGSHLLRFGNLAPGADPVTREKHDLEEFAWLQGEYVVVTIVDRWKYTPESRELISEVHVPESTLAEWVEQAADYVQDHPEVIGKIAQIIIPAVT